MKYTLTNPQNITQYSSSEGIFYAIVDGRIVSYATCRDSLERRCQEFIGKLNANMTGEVLQIGIKLQGITPEKLKAFWKPMFKKLGKDSVVLFHTCNYSDTIIVNTRKFWMQHQISRSIFSMLLRASAVYPNFNEASKNYYLLRDTLPALQHFLNGNTKATFQCENYNRSFYFYFANEKKPDLASLLIKP